MKTITQYFGPTIEPAQQYVKETLAQGKTEEENNALFAERFKFEGDKLKMFLAAVDATKDRLTGLKRIVVVSYAEGEKVQPNTIKKDEYHFALEYFPAAQAEMNRRDRGGRDSWGDRGGRDGGRGGDRGRGGRDSGRGRDGGGFGGGRERDGFRDGPGRGQNRGQDQGQGGQAFGGDQQGGRRFPNPRGQRNDGGPWSGDAANPQGSVGGDGQNANGQRMGGRPPRQPRQPRDPSMNAAGPREPRAPREPKKPREPRVVQPDPARPYRIIPKAEWTTAEAANQPSNTDSSVGTST